MKITGTAFMLTLLFAGCAHSQKQAPPADQASAAEAARGPTQGAESSDALSRELKVPFPYRYYRRGVEIQVNSVEFKPDQLLVSATFKDTRNETAELTGANLMKVRTTGGLEFAYQGYQRGGSLQTGTVPVSAGERFTVDLAYQRTPGTGNSPVNILFPSGKWWSSQ